MSDEALTLQEKVKLADAIASQKLKADGLLLSQATPFSASRHGAELPFAQDTVSKCTSSLERLQPLAQGLVNALHSPPEVTMYCIRSPSELRDESINVESVSVSSSARTMCPYFTLTWAYTKVCVLLRG